MDLGKGDVVEAVRDLNARGYGRSATQGQRATVVALRPSLASEHARCCRETTGLELAEFPLVEGLFWCPCAWRRVGPGRAETVRLFREDLAVGPGLPTTIPETVTA